MKKKMISLLLAMLFALSLGGCGGEDTQPAAEERTGQRELDLKECGLSFTIPEAWINMENSSLIPTSYVKPEGEIYAKILYQYAPDASMADLSDPNSDVPLEELMTPLVEFLVVKDEHLDSEAVDAELAQFESVEILPEQSGYNFYFLTGYKGSIDHFDADAQAVYRKLGESLPELRESVETFRPDEAAVLAKAEEESGYLNFMSNTLEGDAITSAVFYDYDMTVVNFWASYCYPNINELDALQSFYEMLQEEHPNVNFIQVVIDTPGAEAEDIVEKAYQEAGVRFTGMMPDQNLAAWITENLNGLPTTIFVDKEGKTLDATIEGVQDAAYYMEQTEALLAEMQ